VGQKGLDVALAKFVGMLPCPRLVPLKADELFDPPGIDLDGRPRKVLLPTGEPNAIEQFDVFHLARTISGFGRGTR